MATKEFTATDEEGDEYQVELPTRFEVCPRCEGHGTHLREGIGEHAYSREEFEEAFSDEEEREQYFKRGGRYDVSCERCSGTRVVAVIDVDAHLTPGQRAAIDDVRRRNRELAELNAMERSEILAGC
jgi:hypothetical protein